MRTHDGKALQDTLHCFESPTVHHLKGIMKEAVLRMMAYCSNMSDERTRPRTWTIEHLCLRQECLAVVAVILQQAALSKEEVTASESVDRSDI